MKIRTDFVTNSSSSSFVIAINDNCTLSEIRDFLLSRPDLCKRLLMIYDEYDWIGEDYSRPTTIEEAADVIADEVFNIETSLQLGEWRVAAETYSNEDADPIESFLYDHISEIETENFKVGWS